MGAYMYENIRQKKLLILGATANEIPLVKRAQKFGVHVIVTDYNFDHKLSPAKDVANEYWDISWSDIDTLEQKCIENGINGVVAGFSEIRVDCMISLAERLGLPSYATKKQLETTRNKKYFKDKCREYSIPVIKEYNTIHENIEYPVIVKPVDRAGSIGVAIAKNFDELKALYEDAKVKSLTGDVIIEEYISDAIEMDAHYAIVDGEIILLCTDDIIPADVNSLENKVIQSAWVYPGKYNDMFISNYDKKFRNLIRGMGIKNGTIFFSCFANKKFGCKFFECGYRMWGEQEFEYEYLTGKFNYLDVYILNSLLGNSRDVEFNYNGNTALKGIHVNIYSKSGIIDEIYGFEKLKTNGDCNLVIVDAYEGQVCDATGSISPKIALIGFANESEEVLAQDIDDLYSKISVKDEYGNDMIINYVDSKKILNYWKD